MSKITYDILGPGNPWAWISEQAGTGCQGSYTFFSPKTLPQASTVAQCQRLIDLAPICELNKKALCTRVAGESWLNAVREHLRRQVKERDIGTAYEITCYSWNRGHREVPNLFYNMNSRRHSVKVKCWQNSELAEENTFPHDVQTGFSIHRNGKLSGPWT